MTAVIDYYFTVNSPWSYLGHDRLREVAARHGASIAWKPFDILRVFAASGGLPLAKRPPQRQAYRLVEMRRWSDYLGIPLVLQPASLPAPDEPAALMILAAAEGGGDAGALAAAIMRAIWAEERAMGSFEAVALLADTLGMDGRALLARADTAPLRRRREEITDEAIAANLFGAPSYVLDGEIFWGQDRLDFLDRALRKRG